MSSIQLEKFHYDGLNEQIAVAKTVYSSPAVLDIDHIKWKHLNAPQGESTVITLRDEQGFLQGRCFIQPKKFWISNSFSCCGAIVADLVINPLARNASTLIGMTRALRAPTGIDVVVHTSNEVSDQIYRKLFKFPIACNLVALGLPIYFTKIFGLHLKCRKTLTTLDFLCAPWRWFLLGLSIFFAHISKVVLVLNPPESVISEIFNDFKGVSGSHFERNVATYKWRFLEGPLFNGDIKWVQSRGVCIGCIVVKQVELKGLNACVLMDVVMRRDLTGVEKMAIKSLFLNCALKLKSDVLFTLANINNSALKWLKGFPLITIPDQFLPHSTPIFIHSSEDIYPLLNRKNIYITLADLDYF